jgi:hypothetical protein
VRLPWRPEFDFVRNLIWCCNFIMLRVFLCFCNAESKNLGRCCLLDRSKPKIKYRSPFFFQSLKDCLFILSLPDSVKLLYPIWRWIQQFPLNSRYKSTWLRTPEDYVIALDTFQVALSLSNVIQEIMNFENTKCTVSYTNAYATIFVRIM